MGDDVTQLPEALNVRKIATFVPFPTALLEQALSARLVGPPSPEQQEENRRRAEAERAEAHADYQATRTRLADNPQALAALDLHHPAEDGWPHCVFAEYDEYDTEWPCATYTAIKEA